MLSIILWYVLLTLGAYIFIDKTSEETLDKIPPRLRAVFLTLWMVAILPISVGAVIFDRIYDKRWNTFHDVVAVYKMSFNHIWTILKTGEI